MRKKHHDQRFPSCNYVCKIFMKSVISLVSLAIIAEPATTIAKAASYDASYDQSEVKIDILKPKNFDFKSCHVVLAKKTKIAAAKWRGSETEFYNKYIYPLEKSGEEKRGVFRSTPQGSYIDVAYTRTNEDPIYAYYDEKCVDDLFPAESELSSLSKDPILMYRLAIRDYKENGCQNYKQIVYGASGLLKSAQFMVKTPKYGYYVGKGSVVFQVHVVPQAYFTAGMMILICAHDKNTARALIRKYNDIGYFTFVDELDTITIPPKN